jgi:phosphoesterase RecJ-like protein
LQAKSAHIKAAKRVLDFIHNSDHFLLSAHINADGDAVASVIAMGILLENLDKTYYMVFHDNEIDTRFNYLKNYDKIYNYNSSLDLPIQAAIILDVPGLKRLGSVAKLLPDRSMIVKIDHHPTEDDFAIVTMVDEGASSSTQLVYEVIEQAEIAVGNDLAHAIYTGIVYDTGRFSFSNTTARDMYICAEMINRGVEPSKINDRLFFENSFEAIRTIGEGLADMENYLNGAVNVIYLNNETMNRNHHGEIEELANYSVAIRGGKVGIFIREVRPKFHKVSLRAKDDIDVNKIAKAFGGGGHSRAAGCRIDGTKDEVIQRILAEIDKQLSS